MQIEADWEEILKDEIEKGYFRELSETIQKSYVNDDVFPPQELVFNAFKHCSFDKVKVVILGQDPYHGPGQAHGLSFSVPDEVKTPPSLRNIYKEIKEDIGTNIPESGNLERWAKQGVLLLNATLTVRAGEAGSHQGLGWERFTNAVIEKVSTERDYVVFMLWGNYARSKTNLIEESKHLILEAPHPSPLSAHRGFLGCRHFSKCNEYLKKNDQSSIEW